MELIVSTRNPDKLAELRDLLAGLGLEVRSAAEFPQIPEVEETGETLEANAFLKARAAHQATGLLSLADDTGLEIDALGGAPGVHSARFAGPGQSYEKNLQKVLDHLTGIPAAQRQARFRTAVAIVFPDGSEQSVAGVCEGVILSARRGSGGFGYDPVFYIPGAAKTFSEMALPEKQALSHRGKAMALAKQILQDFLS